MSTTPQSFFSFADELNLEQCHAYVIHHLRAAERAGGVSRGRPGPAITISYQLGAGAREVARALAAALRAGSGSQEAPWTVFDRELIEAVVAEYHLSPERVPRRTEAYRPYLQEVLEEILDLSVPSAVLTPKIEAMVRRLVEAGNVILMGHCGNLIARALPYVFHVRLVAPFETRVERVGAREGWGADRAAELVRDEDRGRKLYAKQRYQQRADDALLYHLVVNTGCVGCEAAAALIAQAAQRRFGQEASQDGGLGSAAGAEGGAKWRSAWTSEAGEPTSSKTSPAWSGSSASGARGGPSLRRRETT